jgi:alpha-glucosidase
MSAAKSGWEHCNPAYEEHYYKNVPVGTTSHLRSGWVYPALFKVKNHWALITEAGIDGTYCGSKLVNDSLSPVYNIGFPDAREVFTGKGHLPVHNKPWYTPWRIIAVGSLQTIAESTLGTDLAPKATNANQTYIKPGKASWSWINSKDNMIVYAEQKKYVDFASMMKWQYCLIDVNWDTKIGYDSIKILADYAAKKNVGLILWYNSAGDWNTVKYHPKDLLLTKESREKEFSRLQAMGIKGVKIDFFGGDGQSVMQYYIDILNDAARYQLLVNFHGATLPRGWHKTYPNLMSAEAVYGMEMVTFGQAAADAQPSHCTMLPFTRNAFDPMDFTPMNLTGLTHSKSIRKTTPAFELALSVLFLSGIQHYAQNPEAIDKVPASVIQMLQTLPNNWDDVKFIEGYPGKYVVLARRSGNKWYIAGINGENEARKIVVDLKPFKKGSAQLLGDVDEEGLFRISPLSVNNKMALTMKPNGGFVAVLE